MKNIFFIILECLFINFQALPQQTTIYKENLLVTGNETGNNSGTVINTSFQSTKFNSVITGDLTYNFVSTSLFTGYDLQSNGTPQQIWQDPVDPNIVYMVFTTSAEVAGWPDRNGRFLFSDDMGNNWADLGNVQIGTFARGGFVTINGLNNGRPIVGLHTNDEITPTRTQIYVRNFAGTGWTRYDPGPSIYGEGIWPRVLGIGTDRIVFTSSINGSPEPNFLSNSLDLTNGTFSGWNSIIGDQAETQNVAKSDDETIIGLAYVGNGVDSLTFGNMYYRQSLDGGTSWSNPLQIYTYDYAGDSLGAMRGMDIIFLNNEPYVVFEVIKQDFSAQSYVPSFPNKIMLWSPNLNSGLPVVIADSNNIPYFEQFNASNDVFGVLCRPSIGKAADNQAIFITVNAATEHYLEVGANKNTYYAGYFMYSTNGGITFSDPEKFTPELPLRDWRYINLNPVNYVDPLSRAQVLMSAQSDTIPGSTINSPFGFPVAVSAELIFISTEIQLYPGAPAVFLTTPNGGENWVVGSTKTIRWVSYNVDNVIIEYTTNSGSSWIIIEDSIPSTGSYEWLVPNTLSNTCKIRITDLSDPVITDTSNNNFSIVAINITSPNGGEIWFTRLTYNITWISNDISDVKLELSTNNGLTWSDIISSTPSTGAYNWTVPETQSTQCLIRITDIANPSVSDKSDNVFTIQGTSGIDELFNEIPVDFSLQQNFPNPFNPSTTIVYGIPEGSDVSLNIFNLLGEKIAELVNEYKEPGYYKVNFNFEGFNSGIYLYKIKAGEFVKTKKMILLK